MVTTTIKLPFRYRARDYQREFWEAWHSDRYDIFVLNWHRRGGKDVTCWNASIERVAELGSASGKYAFPTNDMSRVNLWEAYTNEGMRFTDFIPMELRVREHKGDDGLNNSLKRINLITGGSLRVISAHIPNRLRGGNDKLFSLSEFQLMDPMVIDIIMPILFANGGKLLINMTSNGDSSAKEQLKSWQKMPRVYVSVLTVDDTPVFSAATMEQVIEQTIANFAARGQSEEEAIAFIRQEYYCDWDSPVIGSYFGTAMRQAERDGRITSVPYEADVLVDTWWDLGIDDSMSIWFVQIIGREIRLIDYLESSGEGLPYYASELAKKGYRYGRHYGPHDLSVRELATGVSREDTAKRLGINFSKVQRPARKEDGINAIRNILSRCWFDAEKCKRGIAALKGYRKEWNDKLMVYKDVPVHDWTSHGTDAFQTGALANPQPVGFEVGGRVTKTFGPRSAKMPPMIVNPDGSMSLPLDFRRAYARKRPVR